MRAENKADYYRTNARFLEPTLRDELDRIRPEAEPLPELRGDPSLEAQELIAQYDLRPQGGITVVLGFGLGYHIKELFSILGFKEKVVIVEGSLSRFKMALSLQNLVAILSAPNMELILGQSPEETIERLRKKISFDKLNRVEIVEHPSSCDSNPHYYQRIRGLLKNSLDIRRANLETFGVFAQMWAENILGNLGEIIGNPPVESLFGRLSGHPAIIISAGPSLDKNIDRLSRAKGKALLVCVGSALKPCLAHGIRPDLIVDVDARPKHLKKFEGIDQRDIALVADPILYPPIMKMFEGIKLIASSGHPIMDWVQSYLEFPGIELTPLRTGGSVSTVAFDLARRLGADPIIFIGLDLSLPGDKVYVDGAYIDDRVKRQYLEDELTFVEDIEGEKVRTNRRMALYLRWLEEEIALTPATCINATEGGVLKEGVVLMELSRAIDKYCQHQVGLEDLLNQAQRFSPEVEIDSLKRDIERFIHGFAQLERMAEEALMVIGGGGGQERLETINRAIDQIGATRLIGEVIEGVLWQINLQTEDAGTEDLSPLYLTLKEASKRMESLMRGVILEI